MTCASTPAKPIVVCSLSKVGRQLCQFGPQNVKAPPQPTCNVRPSSRLPIGRSSEEPSACFVTLAMVNQLLLALRNELLEPKTTTSQHLAVNQKLAI
jgi:hypothetical protein